jgi:hypothetical protein
MTPRPSPIEADQTRTTVPDRHRLQPAPFAGRLPSRTLGRELLVVLARPRALALKVGIPLVLAVPLIAGHAPTFWAATLLTVLVAMVGAVGAAVSLARSRQSGLLARLALSPRAGWRVLGGVVGAAVIVDAIQLIPVVTLVGWAGGAPPDAWVALGIAVLTALVCGNVLGCVVATVAGGAGEVLLDVTVLLAPLLFLGGLFTGVPRDGWRGAIAVVDPFGELHSAFVTALGGSAAFAAGTIVTVGVAAIGLSAAVVAGLSRPLLERR